MSKRTKRNNRYLKKGGDIIGTYPSQPVAQPSSFTTLMNEAKNAAKRALSSVSLAASSAANSASSAANSAASSATNAFKPTPPPRTFGGKKRRKGGDSAQFLLTPGSISGIQTAKPQVWVGGKTRKRSCNKRAKSCKKGNRKKRAKTMKFPFSNSLKRLIKL